MHAKYALSVFRRSSRFLRPMVRAASLTDRGVPFTGKILRGDAVAENLACYQFKVRRLQSNTQPENQANHPQSDQEQSPLGSVIQHTHANCYLNNLHLP